MFEKRYIRFALLVCITSFSLYIFFTFFYHSWSKTLAVNKGISWLVAQRGILDKADAITDYKKLYKVSTNEKSANNLSKIIKDLSLQSTNKEMALNLSDDKNSGWTNIRPAALDLIDKKCGGTDVSSEAEYLENILLKNKDQMMISIPNSSSSIITTLYFLGKLGYQNQNLDHQILEYLERSEGDSIYDLYGLTHLIFISSDYFSTYLDPSSFQKEIEIFNRTLDKYSSVKHISPAEVDILSEVIISLKLLHQDNTKQVELISEKITYQQNSDGSWGELEEPLASKEHHTVVATLALMDFAKTFRKTDIFCISN